MKRTPEVSRFQLSIGISQPKCKTEQDKVNTADSEFIFLIIQSQNQWSGLSGRRGWSCLVWSLLESQDDFDSEYIGVNGSLMINMAFMPLYM